MKKLVQTDVIQRVEGSVDKIPEFKGAHFWTILLCYRVNPEVFMQGNSVLDLENLVHVTRIACFFCSVPYTDQLQGTICRGSDGC